MSTLDPGKCPECSAGIDGHTSLGPGGDRVPKADDLTVCIYCATPLDLRAAMLKADSTNLPKLKDVWPDVWEELSVRYNAPGGLLPPKETP